jgi:protein TonB
MPCQKPKWPKEAIRKELTGTVTMKFLIDVDGRVLEKEIVKSSGHEILDLAALEATAHCKLTVAPKNGNLEKEWVMNQYVWTLN